MKFKSIQIIKELEKYIETGYSLKIFKGYRAINKRGAEKLIDEIYENLPIDVQNARSYLQDNNIPINSETKSTIYDNLKNLEISFNKTFNFAQYIVLNVKEIEKILNKIYDNLPDEIIKVKDIDKE